jgi:hypothetical protein
LEAAIVAHGGFEFNLELESKEAPKGKLVIPVEMQRMFIAQNILQEQAPLSMDQRC